MHFLLWTKRFHENTDFDIFKCSDENLPNSSCHFPNHKSVFLQIWHDSSVSWNTLLCTFLGQTLYTLHKRDQSKCKFFRLFRARIKIRQFLVIFETKNKFLFKFCTTLWYQETWLLYTFFSCNFSYILSGKVAYQSTNFVKFHLSSRKSEILDCGELLL